MHIRRPAALATAAVLLAATGACHAAADTLRDARSQPAVEDRAPAAAAARQPDVPRGFSAERTAHTAAQSALHVRIAGLLARPDLQVAGDLGVAVVDQSGRSIVSHDAYAQLVPASAAKLVTAAAALEVFGADHRFVTPVRATAPIGPGGTVDGDLVVVGAGDPALASPQFGRDVWPQRPRTPMEVLADRVAQAGVRVVTGDVVGDPSVFADQPLAAGWETRYLSSLDATPVSGLTANAGRHLFKRDGRLLGEPAADPAAEAARQLLELLEQRGVVVRGGPRSVAAPADAPVALAEVASPPLRVLLRHTLQESDNHMADGIFRAVGIDAGTPTTWTAAEAAVLEALDGLGVETAGLVLADGSGLSRHNRVSAAAFAQLEAAMHRSPLVDEWRELMAVMGESGTLRRRLRGTPAEGRVRGKTGTLSGVRALAASVEDDGGARYHFAVIGNSLTGGDPWTVRRIQDEIALALVADPGGVRSGRAGHGRSGVPDLAPAATTLSSGRQHPSDAKDHR